MTNIILNRPIITEKSLTDTAKNKFAFKVTKNSTKHQIKAAVESAFNVNVVRVRTSTNAHTTRRVNRSVVTAPGWKKAIVELKPGQKIELFDTKSE